MKNMNHFTAYGWYIDDKSSVEPYTPSDWYQYWNDREYKNPYICSEESCTNNATVVAYVKNKHMKNLGKCKIPLCSECAKRKNVFNIKLGIPILEE